MAECTNLELRKWREQRKLTRWQVALEIGVSQDTLRRWETGQATPQPDDVDKLEMVYQAEGLWHAWMRSHYDSYRERYPEAYHDPVPELRMRHEMDDVSRMQDAVERDTMDGKIDNPVLRKEYAKELRDVMAAAISVLTRADSKR